MGDVVSREVRSKMMSSIRAKDTQPEMVVRTMLHAKGFRFRLHVRDLPGTPDIALPKWRVAVFVHGCFWHGHAGCPYFRLPKSNAEFWRNKISRNRDRDEHSLEALQAEGWRTAVVWECALRESAKAVEKKLDTFLRSKRLHTDIALPRRAPSS